MGRRGPPADRDDYALGLMAGLADRRGLYERLNSAALARKALTLGAVPGRGVTDAAVERLARKFSKDEYHTTSTAWCEGWLAAKEHVEEVYVEVLKVAKG